MKQETQSSNNNVKRDRIYIKKIAFSTRWKTSSAAQEKKVNKK